MRIAYLTARYPFPPIGGDRMRVYYTLRHLLQSHEVTLYTVASKVKLNSQSRHSDLPGLRLKAFPMKKVAYCWNGAAAFFSDLPLQVRLYESPELIRTLDADIRGGAFDILFVHLIRMAEYARPYTNIPRILDMADSIYLHYARMRKVCWSPWWVGARMEQNRGLDAETGIYHAKQMIALADSLDAIRRQLTNLYVIGCKPTDSKLDGTYRKVRVVAQLKGVTVRYKPGYFATAGE